LIVTRSEAGEIQDIPGWILLFGRRKVGKTFLLKSQVPHDVRFSVRRDLTVEGCRDAQDLVDRTRRELELGHTVIIDEFQRLPDSVLEDIAQVHPAGRLILCGSSMGVVNQVLSRSSPMLGLLTPFRLDLIRPTDVLNALSKQYDARTSIELGTFARDPWLIPLLGDTLVGTLGVMVRYTKLSVPGLVGEVFAEEDRKMTMMYDSMLRLIGSGTWDTKKMSSLLYSRGAIDQPGSHRVSAYVSNLEQMGLVESVPLLGGRSRYLRLRSAIMMLHYYLDDRYGITEREFSTEEVMPTVEVLVSKEIENFIVDLLSEAHGLGKAKRLEDEIDGVLTRRNKIVEVVEVKWKPFEKADAENFLEKTRDLPGEKMLVCAQGGGTGHGEVTVLGPEQLIDLARGRG